MKVGTQEGDHQLGKGTKAFNDPGHPIDDITFIVSALNPPYLLAASQYDIDDGSEINFAYHNPPAVTESQSISSQVREASSNVKDQGLDEETLDNLLTIITILSQQTQVQPYPASWLRWQNDIGRNSPGNPRW